MSASMKYPLAGNMIRVVPGEKTIVCGDIRIDLTRRPLCYRLFQLFAEAPERGRTKAEILRHIYPISETLPPGSRLMRSLNHNLLKLISRARQMARARLLLGMEVDWFVYDIDEGKWYLCQPTIKALLAVMDVPQLRRVSQGHAIIF